ncbi:ABC transporter ATP-binding protein [Lacticaseibacillus brantae]|uniref:ABC-type quaternary amine transporter n=1 Tax=Lacticaseibacillus brantae DSM 23927 TaxID=1423727 RepID=A0A0R2AWZ3_9LACO|nr:ABC transporter ATP-binding protein [Lacticaseibacillus brantae]KRM71317.1 ABC-type proline glycine betaine transport system, ATPase component [Lacticaseibacillus brantae DSM 23927]
MIELRHLTKEYEDGAVVDDLNLTIETGELFVLVGASGSGKTTTLKMINRLITPTSGEVLFDGKPASDYPIRELRFNIGYVLQQIALFPTMTVAQNIALIPELKHWPKAKITQTVNDMLDRVDLPHADYGQRLPAELSGGEQQRVGILRALASQPDVVLMDEPFSALDPIARTQLQDLVLRLHQDMKTTIIFVTHDMREALKLGDRIAVMKTGHLQQVGTPDVVADRPDNPFVAELFADIGTSPLQAPAAELAPFAKTQVQATASIQAIAVVEQVIQLLKVNQAVTVQAGTDAFVVTAQSVVDFLAQKSEVKE